MRYLIHMVNARGVSKIKLVEAIDVKDAEEKAKEKYQSHTVNRITSSELEIDYYMSMKKIRRKPDANAS
jgi:hypothetical protein